MTCHEYSVNASIKKMWAMAAVTNDSASTKPMRIGKALRENHWEIKMLDDINPKEAPIPCVKFNNEYTKILSA